MRRFAEDAAERSEVDTSVVNGVDDDEEAAAEDVEVVVEAGGGGTPNPVTRADLRQQGARPSSQRNDELARGKEKRTVKGTKGGATVMIEPCM